MQATQFQIRRENETQRLQFISSLPDVDLPYLESITLRYYGKVGPSFL
jgi:hypothetical protein